MDWKQFAGGVAAKAPVISSISPTSGSQNTSVPITVTGTGFKGSATLISGDPNITFSALTVTSTQITATMAIGATAAIGSVSIFAMNTNSPISNGTSFTVGVGIFSDNFLRNAFGFQWQVGYSDPRQASFVGGCTFTPNGSGGVVAGNTTGGASQVCLTSLCMPLFPLAVPAGQAQFAEIKITATTGGGINIGPCVATFGVNTIGGNDANGYTMATFNSSTQYRLLACNNAQTTLNATVGTLAINDVFRVSVVFGGGSNTIKIWQNGVVLQTTVDAAVGRPTNGIPGICFGGAGAGLNTTFTNFRGGPGDGT